MRKFALYLLIDRLAGGHKGVARVELQCRLLKRRAARLQRKASDVITTYKHKKDDYVIWVFQKYLVIFFYEEFFIFNIEDIF